MRIQMLKESCIEKRKYFFVDELKKESVIIRERFAFSVENFNYLQFSIIH